MERIRSLNETAHLATMKLAHILASGAALAFAACTPYVKVTETNPRRAGFEVKTNDPRKALANYVEAAERAWKKLDRAPNDEEARKDYNFAVARICGTLRESK